MDLLLTVFGAFFLTEFNKTALPWPLHAWVKLCLAVLGAVIMAVLLADELYATASLTLAGAGGSAVVHKAVASDDRKNPLTTRVALRYGPCQTVATSGLRIRCVAFRRAESDERAVRFPAGRPFPLRRRGTGVW
jgi:hypothetical protein